jgi:hypothetical protein
MLSEPITENRDYLAQWVKPPIDLRELAILRKQGWNFTSLAKRYFRDRSTIVKLLKGLEEE